MNASAGAGARGWRWAGAALVVAAVALGFWVRVAGLETSASRTDEINFWRAGMGEAGQSTWSALCALWRDPPWFNQMPTGDSIPIAWCGIFGLSGPGVTIGQVRLPFALLGGLGVAALAAWLWRRRGWGAAWVGAVWAGLLPWAVYHSREAYYYAPELAMASLALPWAVGAMADILEGRRLGGWDFALGAALLIGMCLTHMSAWVPAAVAWAGVGLAIWMATRAQERRVERGRLLGLWVGFSVVILLAMSRWIARGLHEMSRVSTGETVNIGGNAGWVLPRVLPFFSGGANVVGLAVLAAGVVAAGVAWGLGRKASAAGKQHAGDRVYCVTGWMLLAALACNYAYVGGVGGGAAKLSYFSGCWPLFILWMAMGVERLCKCAAARWQGVALVGTGMALAACFWGMTRDVMRLPGRPTPYVELREWLDENLPAGDVAIVDRWLEPWNEMALYAPTNVNVSFTVPDEPYENYVRGQWREKTKAVFEEGRAQAFIRLTRNHEKRMGLWTWPEKFFRHRAVVTNEPGLRMVRNGSAPMEDFYDYPSRLEVEIFYDLRDEVAEKQAARGAKAWVSFGAGWSLLKPWQMGDWNDYRTLRGGKTGMLEVRLHGEAPERVTMEVTASAVGGVSVCRVGRAQFTFEPGMTSVQTAEVVLKPGMTEIPFTVLRAAEGAWLAVESIRIQ